MWEVIESEFVQWASGYRGPKFHAVLSDPPYGLRFMGKDWDVISAQQWGEALLPLLYPGSIVFMFGGTRTWHHLASGMEQAGFEMWDTLMWLHGQGFPKAQDISKLIDAKGGVALGWFGPWLRQERERRGIPQKELAQHFPSKSGGITGCVANWELGLNIPTPEQFNKLCEVLELQFERIEQLERRIVESGRCGRNAIFGSADGTGGYPVTEATDISAPWSGHKTCALKPAWEPILCFRAPSNGKTYAELAIEYGSGCLNVEGGRISIEAGVNTERLQRQQSNRVTWEGGEHSGFADDHVQPLYNPLGRYPANLVLDETSAEMLDEQTGELKAGIAINRNRVGIRPKTVYGDYRTLTKDIGFGDSGGASRFFYCAKASTGERNVGLNERNMHPTVKPIDLCRWLATLLLPAESVKSRHLLVPFCGSGSEIIGALEAGWDEVTGIEQSHDYVQIARARVRHRAEHEFWKHLPLSESSLSI